MTFGWDDTMRPGSTMLRAAALAMLPSAALR
jgi:hypothetical protein